MRMGMGIEAVEGKEGFALMQMIEKLPLWALSKK